jgi:hypothetical protein
VILGPGDGGGLKSDSLGLLGEGRDGCDFGSVEVFLDPAEGDEALEHGEKGLGEGVEGEFELIEDYVAVGNSGYFGGQTNTYR